MTSDHVANHYTALTHAYAAIKASSWMHRQVSSIASPTECLLAITLPSARLLNKGGPTTCLLGLIRNVKVHFGSSDPPSDWNTWEEYLESKPGEFTPVQIAQNTIKIDRTVARILEMFDWYFTSRLIAVISHLNDDWEQTTQVKGGGRHCWTSLIVMLALISNNSSKFFAVTCK